MSTFQVGVESVCINRSIQRRCLFGPGRSLLPSNQRLERTGARPARFGRAAVAPAAQRGALDGKTMKRGKTSRLLLILLGVAGCSFQDHAARVIKGRDFDWTSCACVQTGMSGTDVKTVLGGEPYSTNVAGSAQELRFWAILQRSSTDRFLGIPSSSSRVRLRSNALSRCAMTAWSLSIRMASGVRANNRTGLTAAAPQAEQCRERRLTRRWSGPATKRSTLSRGRSVP